MLFREAQLNDIPQIQVVRHAVRENRLSDPSLVPDTDVADYIKRRGKGWVCIVDNMVVGFSIVSVMDNNVWALFLEPSFEGKGIGKKLHHDMMDWYFNQTKADIWLSTAPGTRAESFYHKAGWRKTGITKSGEVRFEMSASEWKSLQNI